MQRSKIDLTTIKVNGATEMMNIVLTLVFSIVMLFFMLFPAMKIVEWLDSRLSIPQKLHTPLTIIVVILLSLSIGVFLKYA